jgi:pyruvate formate lyase activating enzyme
MFDTIPTHFWHQLPDGRVQCDVCPRNCKLREGQRGLCFVRANINHQVQLTTYGRSSGYCIDPVEKKPLNHFLPGTPVLSFGTAGCNLACKFCQNWDISKSRDIDTLSDKALPDEIARAAKELDCRSVAFTYNDPVVFMEYAMDVAKACHLSGIYSIAVSAGYMNKKPREEFYKYMDAANIDLKSFNEAFYYKITGSHLQPVLDTLVYLKKKTQVWFEITNLVIPGENDTDAEFEQMSQWIYDKLGPEVPLHFTAFHPDWKMRDKPPTPLSTLQRARRIALASGLYYVYTGNVHDVEGSTTYCPGCQLPVIVRDWYQILGYHLDDNGCCRQCKTAIAGFFQGKPGHWGRKRRMVNLSQWVQQP